MPDDEATIAASTNWCVGWFFLEAIHEEKGNGLAASGKSLLFFPSQCLWGRSEDIFECL